MNLNQIFIFFHEIDDIFILFKLTQIIPVLRETKHYQKIICELFEYNYNYPLFRFLGEPTTPRLARGEEDLSTHLSTTLDTNADNELVAKQTGDTNSIIQIKENLK